MFKLSFIVLIISLVSTFSSAVVLEWEQCDGMDYYGDKTCDSGLECIMVNEWYSQCQKSASYDDIESDLISEWDQCDGKEYTGVKTCKRELECVFINEWYSQCQKSSSNSATTTAASTTTPKTTTSQTTHSTPNIQTSTASTGTSNNKFNQDCLFKYGRAYDGSISDYSDYDYISIWLGTIDWSGSTDFNPWHHGKMLETCVAQKKMPLFYSYIIAFEARSKAGLQDCDVGHPSLCEKGAQFIRENRNHILERYSHQAKKIAEYISKNGVATFLIEPDFWQYYGDAKQEGGTNSGQFMRDLFDDIAKRIRAELPNAIISWDISAWLNEKNMEIWWNFFKTSPYIDYIHTSGGQAHGETSQIKPNELSWKFMNQLTGKKIIADCGYGVGGADSDNCYVWNQNDNLTNRKNDGVISLSFGSNPFKPTKKPSVC